MDAFTVCTLEKSSLAANINAGVILFIIKTFFMPRWISTILTEFHNFDWNSQLQLKFTISTEFHNFNWNSQLWLNFTISTEYQFRLKFTISTVIHTLLWWWHDHWWWLMMIDDHWWWLKIIDDDWWWLMIIDDDWSNTSHIIKTNDPNVKETYTGR